MTDNNELSEITYGLIDENGILINAVVAIKDDVQTLNALLEHHNAVAYHVIDQRLNVIRVNEMYWTGTHWDLVENMPS